MQIVRRPSCWAELQPAAQRFYDRMIREQVVLLVGEIDGDSRPWVTHTRPLPKGGYAVDTLAIDDDSWDLVEKAT